VALDDIQHVPLGELLGPSAAHPACGYEEWVIARRKRWRLAKTVVGALLGAAVGRMPFTMTDSGPARR
jgi:hypothetical protein